MLHVLEEEREEKTRQKDKETKRQRDKETRRQTPDSASNIHPSRSSGSLLGRGKTPLGAVGRGSQWAFCDTSEHSCKPKKGPPIKSRPPHHGLLVSAVPVDFDISTFAAQGGNAHMVANRQTETRDKIGRDITEIDMLGNAG